MIFNYNKYLALVISIISPLYVQCLPTHQEILDELALVRQNTPQLQWDSTPFVKYYQDRMDEAKILDATEDNATFWQTYIAFKVSAFLARIDIGDMVLLTCDNAPKTYEFIADIAKKVGLEEMPYVYLVSDQNLFNAFAHGFSPSTSIMGLGENLILKTINTQGLEFVIAHELAHVKKRHLAKQLSLKLAAGIACIATDIYIKGREHYFSLAWPTWKEILTALGVNGSLSLLYAWHSRVCEREADAIAAQAVGAQGGIEFFLQCKEIETKQKSIRASVEAYEAETNPPSKLSKLAKKLRGWLEIAKTPFLSHPSHDERIDYLVKLKEQQENQVATQA